MSALLQLTSHILVGFFGQNDNNFFHYGNMAIKTLIAENYLSVFLQSFMEEEGRSR